MPPLVVAGCECLLKIPARVIGKATSVHEGQPAHVTIELALSEGPSQVTIVFPNADEASVFDEKFHYEGDPKNPGTQIRVDHEPQRLYILVCDADVVDEEDKQFQAALAAGDENVEKPEENVENPVPVTTDAGSQTP